MIKNPLSFIIPLLCISAVWASNLTAKELSFDKYKLTTNTFQKTITYPMDQLSCKDYQTGKHTFTLEKTQQYTSSAKTELLTEVESSLTGGISLDTPLAVFKQTVSLHLKAQKAVGSAQDSTLKLSAVQNREISALPCFDIRVLLLHEEETTNVEGVKEALFDKNINFKLVNATGWRFRFEATFNPNCSQCESKVSADFIPVLDLNGKGVNIEIETKNGWSYMLPLYRNRNWELANLINFLPVEIRPLIRAEQTADTPAAQELVLKTQAEKPEIDVN